MRRHHRPVPVWFYAVVGAIVALAWRALEALVHGHPIGVVDAAPIQLAFWQFIGIVAGLIWDVAQTAYDVLVIALQWSVKALWSFAVATYNALVKFGALVGKGLRESWDFLRATYDHVLKPAWDKFWRFIDRVKGWLDKYLGPVFEFIEKVRKYLLDWYTKYVRPFLDAIGVARRILRMLGELGIGWARTLDKRLGDVEGWVDGIYRRVLSEVNRVVNIINRVVDANGLFQRLALVRSIERDIRYVSRSFANWKVADAAETTASQKAIREHAKGRTLDKAKADLIDAVTTGQGRHRGIVSEMETQWKLYMERAGVGPI